MNRLNKIFYGSAGTGKTRQANINAVKIVHDSQKIESEFNDENILADFKKFAKTSRLETDDKKIIEKIQDLSKNINEVVDSMSGNELKKLVGNSDDRKKAKEIIEEYRVYPLIDTVTFHPSYTYQDFVEGISVETTDRNQIIYKAKDGIFKKICDRAISNKDYEYVLIIDEINRGDISSIFGELFTLLEDTKRKDAKEELSINLPYSKDPNTGNPKKLTVPQNLHILATMNTVDKSIALIDVALRRRFEFVEMKPNPELLKNLEDSDINLNKMLSAINERISILKNEHYQIGHSYFLNIESFSDLKDVMTKSIIPLLQEYFYDDWQSICAVLNQSYANPIDGQGLFNIKKTDDKMFSHEFKNLIEFNNKKIVTIRNFNQNDIISIY
ncbi:McrB family protein [Poseidonibacter sp.]|uniref:McrB family protein n=1 Tax=Poseidonibacter sp. TaxID=2321188 RepID=UPI003C753979